MKLKMDLPVSSHGVSQTFILKYLVYIVISWMLLTFVNCQNELTDKKDNKKVTTLEHINNGTRDTNWVTSLLKTALSGNQAIFDALDKSKKEQSRKEVATMAPTHFPAFNMKESTWSIQQNRQAATKQDTQSVPIVRLPRPLALIEKKLPASAQSSITINSSKDSGSQKALPLTASPDSPNADSSNDPGSQKSLPLSASHDSSNAGIVIPMHKLLRARRQTRGGRQAAGTRGGRQAAGTGARRVMMLINPTAAPNRTLEAQRVMFLMRQPNNPLYNVTFGNSTGMGGSNQLHARGHTAQTLPPRGTTAPSKQALQSLSDLNLVDLTFPLMARNNHLGPTHDISASTRLNQTQRLGSSGVDNQRFLSTLQQNRTSHGSFSNQGRQTRPTRPAIFQVTRPTPRSNPRILNLRLQNTRQPSSPSAATRIQGRQSINRPAIVRRPSPSLTIVQPVSGRRISSSSSRRVQSSGQRTPSSSARRTPSSSARRTPSTRTSSSARISSTAGRRTPTSRIISTRRRTPTATRTIIRAQSGVTRRQPVRRPSTLSRSGSRRATTQRRTVPQRRRRVQARRRRPADPFTQRFSAGFQRGSSLLHQPPMDFTSFDGSTGGADGARPPQGPGFMNTLALQGGLPFAGGPGPGVFGGAGMFLGGPPGFL